ncbi:hypothetical protein NUW54_g14564 [Trametes sanguinea]|uniref:Uncharacterized protein n=1 Tax=Trametes sanguinea TaxID=158606 RepID=A0ACC1MBH7_9APHY|nr:hypothetical protein NUW54_g14564 [Trametes sanguinea]
MVPKIVYNQDDPAKRDISVTNWVVNPVVVKEYDDLLIDLYPIALRAISIIENKEYAMQAKIEKKKSIEKDASDQMAVDPPSGPSLQALVDKAVGGKVKALEAKFSKLSVVSGKKTASNLPKGGKAKPKGKAKSSSSFFET